MHITIQLQLSNDATDFAPAFILGPSYPPITLMSSHEILPSLPHLAPTQSLELRIRWLEALLYGPNHDESFAGLRVRKPEMKRDETLVRAAEHAQRRLNDIASSYDVLRKFISHCKRFSPSPPLSNSTQNNTDEQHAQYLTPAFALSGTLPTIAPSEYTHMSPAELAALATELEPDIRAADNDMREIDALQQKGVTGAGKLSGAPSRYFSSLPFNSTSTR